MTAEIAVMNEEAVALAADSAVTGPKIFTSANKIFMLSKHHPVGVMVFDSAQLLDVPWETIIKQYRRELGAEAFPTLSEHADHFIQYFDRENRLFPSESQERAVELLALTVFSEVRDASFERLEARLDEEGELTPADVVGEIARVADKWLTDWRGAENLPTLPTRAVTSVGAAYKDRLDKAVDDVFQRVALPGRLRADLRRIVALVLTKDMEYANAPFHSGVVIAGFGEDDVFPRLRSYRLEAIARNRLKFTEREPIAIGPENRAAIIPFAQQEQVNTFIEGVDPGLTEWIQVWWFQKLGEIMEEIFDRANVKEEARDAGLRDALYQRFLEVVSEEFREDLSTKQRADYVWPIIKIVGMLPKDELAAMAESFVNLTSFKRRVSEDAETVGGPIDVAVISRGDGFIWIKRKHYFSPELNQQFFANYYPEER